MKFSLDGLDVKETKSRTVQQSKRSPVSGNNAFCFHYYVPQFITIYLHMTRLVPIKARSNKDKVL